VPNVHWLLLFTAKTAFSTSYFFADCSIFF
jgi:hypothetical protein